MAANHNSHEQLQLFDIDGPRPAYKYAVVARWRWRLTLAEHLVTRTLAADSFDGRVAAPTWDELCYGAGLYKGDATKAVRSLKTERPDRPLLLATEPGRGRKRTRYFLLFADPALWDRLPEPVEPRSRSGIPDRLDALAGREPRPITKDPTVVGRESPTDKNSVVGLAYRSGIPDRRPALSGYFSNQSPVGRDTGPMVGSEDQNEPGGTIMTECRICQRPFPNRTPPPPGRVCAECRPKPEPHPDTLTDDRGDAA